LTGAASIFAFQSGYDKSGASSESGQMGLVGFLFKLIGFFHTYNTAGNATIG
jgi:hypothetical protein